MRVIGLTGGIATGKSTVAAMLAARGAVVVDADVLAREVIAPGEPGYDEVVGRFGRDIVDASGLVDRAALGAIVFADSAARADLEAITHPRIGTLMQARIRAALGSSAPLAVADIPLLFERGRDAAFPQTLLVYAPRAVQLLRMRERDGWDAAAAQSRLDAQLPIDEKRARATWVIDNGGSLDATAAQVGTWWDDVVVGHDAG
ncbi:MAG TPA: dephospho-CoA kinase [Candidatus Dormibacteraeota bacterium]|jgi:dephospho-CoA kinase